ncbi:MAG TPA: hypothetical protein VG274_05945 [Rhizomicrobium sp.]|jgi:flavorubredoxin|nr:hypothetical protein [Rhizomicrobium sp.]
MTVRVDEVAGSIYRFSTFVPEIAAPAGFTFNQYLVDADEPLLFHCGSRKLFADVSAAVAGVIPLSRLKWISFGHVESDECGSMNQWLAAAPEACVVQGATACLVSLNDMADRAPRILADGETLDLGGKRVCWIDTPHVPHAWESGLLFEITTRTLFCGDLFTHAGDGPATTTDSIVPSAARAEEMFQSTSLTARTATTIRRMASFAPRTLAVMHGSCFVGDCAQQLHELANFYDERFRASAA